MAGSREFLLLNLIFRVGSQGSSQHLADTVVESGAEGPRVRGTIRFLLGCSICDRSSQWDLWPAFKSRRLCPVRGGGRGYSDTKTSGSSVNGGSFPINCWRVTWRICSSANSRGVADTPVHWTLTQ